MWHRKKFTASLGKGWHSQKLTAWTCLGDAIVVEEQPFITSRIDPLKDKILSWKRFAFNSETHRVVGENGEPSIARVYSATGKGALSASFVLMGSFQPYAENRKLRGIECTPNKGRPVGYISINEENPQILRSRVRGLSPSSSLIGHRSISKVPFISFENSHLGLFSTGVFDIHSWQSEHLLTWTVDAWPQWLINQLYTASLARWWFMTEKENEAIGESAVFLDFSVNTGKEYVYVAYVDSQKGLEEYLYEGTCLSAKFSLKEKEWDVVEKTTLNQWQKAMLKVACPVFEDKNQCSSVMPRLELEQSEVNNKQKSSLLLVNPDSGGKEQISTWEADIPPVPVLQREILYQNEQLRICKIYASSNRLADPPSSLSPLIWFRISPFPSPPSGFNTKSGLSSVKTQQTPPVGSTEWAHAQQRDVYVIDLYKNAGLDAQYAKGSFSNLLRLSLRKLADQEEIIWGRAVLGGYSFGATAAATAVLTSEERFLGLILRNGSYNRSNSPLGFQTFPKSIAGNEEIYEEFNVINNVKRASDTNFLIETSMQDSNCNTAPWQSLALYEAIRAYGGSASLLRLERSDHFIKNIEDRKKLFHIEAEWIDSLS